MPEAANITVEDGLVKYVRQSFWQAGVDDFTDPPAQDPDTFLTLHNVIAGVRPRLIRRWGTTLFSNPTMNAERIHETHFVNGRNRFILTATDGSGAASPDNNVLVINENGALVTTAAPVFVPAASAGAVEVAASRDYAFFADGQTADLVKWDTNDDPTATTTSPETGLGIPSVTQNGIDTPAPTGVGGAIDAAATAEGTGNIYLVTGRAYTVIYRNSLSGTTSDIAPFTGAMGVTSDPTDPATGVTVNLSSIPISSDPQVDQRVILATSDGGPQDTLYQVTIINDNTTTTYTDNLSEFDLLNSAIWAEPGIDGIQHGCIGNTSIRNVAGDTTICCAFRGRMYYLQGHFLFWSKSLQEVTTSTGTVAGRWEEEVPIENQTSLSSNGSEVGTAMFTDDVNLYIGTNRAIYVSGSDQPGLAPPRALFHEVGVINNAVWKVIYHAGHAVGAMWLTPEYRVIYSNFNTYEDVGNSIQTALSALGNVSATATATFVGHGPYEFYILAPGGTASTIWVFNVKTKTWFSWQGAYSDPVLAVGYMFDSINRRPLPVYSTTGQKVYMWDSSIVVDHSSETALLPTSTIKTNWLGAGDPALVKCLNSIEVQTDEPSMTVTIEGARNESEFDAPTFSETLSFVSNDFGALWAPCAHLATKHRFYRLTFGGIDDSSASDTLSYLAIELVPFAYL